MAKKEKKEQKKSTIKIIPLGGLGEVGKNCWIVENGSDWIVIDAGLGFPFNEYPGVELIFPSNEYLIENKDKIKALIITHSHEDHIGGATRILADIDIPIVYAPKLTIALLEKKYSESKVSPKAEFKAVSSREEVTVGDIKIEFIRTTHSVPDCFALLIKTSEGNILHTGDFKFDFTPVDGEKFDIPRMVEAGNEGIKLLISDSTNVERDGFSLSEKTVGPHLQRLFEKTNKRIFISTFSSHIHRIQQILNAAKKTGKKVCIHGYSLEVFSQVARETGYLEYEEGLVVSLDEILSLPSNQVVILTSGSQGEPNSGLAKMARNEHKTLQIIPGDVVIFSANPIPGNERAVSKLQDALCELGADLVYGRQEKIHVSGHASREELNLMFALTRPEYFLPAHGDYRMLVQHAELAASQGIDTEKIFILDNGDLLELADNKVIVEKNAVETPPVYFDSIAGGVVDYKVMRDRKAMGQEGLILLYLMVDESDNDIKKIDIIFKGITLKPENEEESIIDEVKDNINKACERMKKFGTFDINSLKTVCRDITIKHSENKLFCKPLIIVMTQSITE